MPDLPVESLDAQERYDLCDCQRCFLAPNDYSRPEFLVIGEIAAHSLGLHHKLEDLLFVVKSITDPPPGLLSFVASVRSSVPVALSVSAAG